MACNLSSGFTTDCLEGLGGAKEIFLANWSEFDGGITIDGTTQEIDGLPTATLYRYVPLKNSIEWLETPTPNAENGTLFYANQLTFRMGGLTAAKRKEFQNLAKAKLIAFVRLYSDKIVCLGREQGLFLSGGQWGSGKALSDFSGYEFQLSSDQATPCEYVEAYTTNPFDNFVDITVSPGYAS